jgi:hypothetical protein
MSPKKSPQTKQTALGLTGSWNQNRHLTASAASRLAATRGRQRKQKFHHIQDILLSSLLTLDSFFLFIHRLDLPFSQL